MCGIIRNQFIEGRRATARRRSLLDNVLEGASSVLGSLFTGGVEQPDPESQACQSEQSALLLRCLHALPEKYRLVVLLCDVEELGYEEVASILGTPVGDGEEPPLPGTGPAGNSLSGRAGATGARGAHRRRPVSKDDETKLPPLSGDARSAIHAFRAERPSPQARFRIHAALQA